MAFFRKHPEFLQTSETAAIRARLNLRYRAIIRNHREILRGARVLDIASHDGRWSFAALKAGTAHVTGIEGRPDLIDNARRTFADKGIDPSRYTFITGDVHDVLTSGVGDMDVVMCLGFLYHTARYPELFAGIRATGAKYLLIDSKVVKARAPIVRLRANPVQIESMAIEDRYSSEGKTLAGVPSEKGIRLMLTMYGYEVLGEPDWPKIISEHPKVKTVKAYASRGRITILAGRRS